MLIECKLSYLCALSSLIHFFHHGFFMRNTNIFLFCLLACLSTFSFAQQWGNFTLIGVQGQSSVKLIDTNSVVFHTWNLGTKKMGYSGYVLPGGDLICSIQRTGNSFMGGGMTGEILKVDKNSNVLWNYVYSTTDYCMHHDICPMPNGNVLVIAYERKTAAEHTAVGGNNYETWPDKIVEIQPAGTNGGNIVWEWHAWDHLCQSANASGGNYVSNVSDHPELLNIRYNNTQQKKDWMHMNGLDYNAELDQIAFSSHYLNEIYVIDHSTTMAEAAGHTGGNSGKGGDLLYRWGNPAAYGITGIPATLKTVHDAHFVPKGYPRAGMLVGFNNQGVSNQQSAVDMIMPPHNGYNYLHTAGQAYVPTSYDKRHACVGYSSNMSNSQQLPNGNMLVCIALSGKVYEVDSNNVVLWTYTATGQMGQSSRYDACHISGTPPAAPTAAQNGTMLSSTTGTTYQWYLNGVAIIGATSDTYTPTQSGNYQVIIRDANGCASDLSNTIEYINSGIDEVSLNEVKFFPNPTTGILQIDAKILGSRAYTVSIADIYGKTLLEVPNAAQLDLQGFTNGVYFVSISTDNAIQLTQKIHLQK